MKNENVVDRLGDNRFMLGVMIVIVGLGMLLSNIFPQFSFSYVWPVLIILIGLFILARRKE